MIGPVSGGIFQTLTTHRHIPCIFPGHNHCMYSPWYNFSAHLFPSRQQPWPWKIETSPPDYLKSTTLVLFSQHLGIHCKTNESYAAANVGNKTGSGDNSVVFYIYMYVYVCVITK